MTVKELKKLLNQYPDDMRVFTDFCQNDYNSFELEINYTSYPIEGINENWDIQLYEDLVSEIGHKRAKKIKPALFLTPEPILE